MTRALKKVETADIELDAQTRARVVESLVIRGDISALTPEERTRFYTQMCDSLGLNPLSNPFAILRLNGKEILYPTRGATDQLAAIHRLNRRIVDGPRELVVGGQKLVYAVCEATHPNGRVETASAMVPLPQGNAEAICNAFLKTETKARRRATLSILGLGMLDETELETIPESAKSPATPIRIEAQRLAAAARATPAAQDEVVVPAEPPAAFDPTDAGESPELGPNAFAELRRALEAADTPARLRAVWHEHAAAIAGACDDGDTRPLSEARKLAFAAAVARGFARTAAQFDALTGKGGVPVPEVPAALRAFRVATLDLELPGECVALWIKRRADLAALEPGEREEAWKGLCDRCEEVGKMKNAKVWLKRAIAEFDAQHGERAEVVQ